MKILPKPFQNRRHDTSEQNPVFFNFIPRTSEDKLIFDELQHFSNGHFTVILSLIQFILNIQNVFVVFVHLVQPEEVVVVLHHGCQDEAFIGVGGSEAEEHEVGQFKGRAGFHHVVDQQ